MEFEYATLRSLEDEGWLETILPSIRARQLIWRASRRINSATSQWFQPVKDVFSLDGRGSGIVPSPALVPILKLNGLELDEGDVTSAYDLSEIDVKNRAIVLKSQALTAIFPQGSGNLLFDAVVGWLENIKDIETTLVNDVVVDEEKATLTSVEGLEVGDVLLIGDDLRVTVDVINTVAKEVEFMKALAGASAGDKVYCYGRVPFDVERACVLIVKASSPQIFSVSGDKARLSQLFKSEKIGDYSYTLGSGAGTQKVTGSGEADMILEDFVAPLLPSFV